MYTYKSPRIFPIFVYVSNTVFSLSVYGKHISEV